MVDVHILRNSIIEDETDKDTQKPATSQEANRKYQREYISRRQKQGMVKEPFEIGRNQLPTGLLPGKELRVQSSLHCTHG